MTPLVDRTTAAARRCFCRRRKAIGAIGDGTAITTAAPRDKLRSGIVRPSNPVMKWADLQEYG
jgi:hypothetical protein